MMQTYAYHENQPINYPISQLLYSEYDLHIFALLPHISWDKFKGTFSGSHLLFDHNLHGFTAGKKTSSNSDIIYRILWLSMVFTIAYGIYIYRQCFPAITYPVINFYDHPISFAPSARPSGHVPWTGGNQPLWTALVR